MAIAIADLRIIVCEDEFLLAMDLAQRLSSLGATVVAIARSLQELDEALAEFPEANAAVLDIQLLDGQIYTLIPDMEQRGFALLFCSGYPIGDRPSQFSHIPWYDKLDTAERLAAALSAASKTSPL